MAIKVRVPGSCGELVQGFCQGRPYLLTCPIDSYATATVTEDGKLRGLGRKSMAALRLVLARLGRRRFPYGLRLESELPRGKGMASSSADIAAVAMAVSLALGQELSPEEILELAVQIEPTDAVFCPGIVCLDPVSGEIFDSYQGWPELRLSVFDTGGTVNTEEFHRRSAGQLPETARPDFHGLVGKELSEILGRAATSSAFAQQARLEKPGLNMFWAAARELGALGVNAAHSGTVLGAIWPEGLSAAEVQRRTSELARQVPSVHFLRQARLISGGIFAN